jgi:uncharacterized glyoxalase superfamily protein PhnB/catechol 2,3-dioxygenase-like lactoylglutathione lyase family enzyme
MSEVVLTEQLDQAIEAMLLNPETRPAAEPTIAELLELATTLREAPRRDFKAQLRKELEMAAGESSKSGVETARSKEDVRAGKVPAGFRTVTPYLVVSDVHEEIDFIQKVFGAEGTVHGLGSAGGFHSEYRIGDSMLMIGGGGKGSKWKGTPVPAVFHLYVENVDGVYQQAMQAGAVSLMPPTDMEYGERSAGIEDVSGNHWYLATAFGSNYIPEGVPNLMPYFHPVGAPKMIEFLRDALGAEEVAVHKSPDGVVQHAKIRIGDSIVEMGEAHGPWQPRPMHFMLYVDDADAWYARAMKAEGAISMGEPANAPYGGRTGAIQDPFGNTWYLSSQIQKEESESESRREIMAAAKLFRVALQVSDLDRASAFYAKLLDDPGIRIPRGSRHYFDCGGVILALVDVAQGASEKPQPTPDYIYFSVNNLDEVFERAKALNCLAKDRFHDQNAGEIVKRPWGELSFYAEDPWGNGLCFVDEKTLFTGK